jgi:prepilin-type N-terminal cleavage/methylation domain-containing protein
MTFAILEIRVFHPHPIRQAEVMKNQKYKHGLSLIEILVVVIIIAILATMVITVVSSLDNRSKKEETEAVFSLLEVALQEYQDFKDVFPEQPVKDFDNVAAHSEYLYGELDSIPNSQRILRKINASLIKQNVDTGLIPPIPEIYDPWGTVIDYRYTTDDTFPELVSAGPDKLFGNGDDINNK